jgi:D-glycero-D-manno-heptose 1,7-bisphosphate phosphatase
MRSAVFIDRDGTIMRDQGYAAREQRIQLISPAIVGLRTLQEHGFVIVMITNQSGIERGLTDEKEVNAVNDSVLARMEVVGISVAGVYVCPHSPRTGCSCRKPKPGLFFLAQREHSLELQSSIVIGDRRSDLEAGYAAGCATGIRVEPSGGGWDEVLGLVNGRRLPRRGRGRPRGISESA